MTFAEGRVIAAAVFGKQQSLAQVQSVESLLKKNSPTTVQYLAIFAYKNGAVMTRVASGKAVPEAAQALTSTSPSCEALREILSVPAQAQSQPEMCAQFNGQVTLPEDANPSLVVVTRKTLLNKDLTAHFNGKVQFGQQCNQMTHQIKLQGKMSRDEAMTKHAQQSPQAQQCEQDEKKGFSISPVCLKVANTQAGALNKGNLVFQVSFSSKISKIFF